MSCSSRPPVISRSLRWLGAVYFPTGGPQSWRPPASSAEAWATWAPSDQGDKSWLLVGGVVSPTSHAGLAWAMAGVSVNTDYIRRYPPKEMKCDGIMLGKFKGLLLPPSQIATSQPGRVTSEVRSKLPVLCFCESKYDTRTLWAGAAGPVPAAAPPYRPLLFSPLRWQPGVAQPGQLASFIWDRRRASPPPRDGRGLPSCF